ncbi:MAG: hypothetical protein OT478_12975 [Cyanobacteria bacterium FC1]|nr:hypothetical protein [Cyanobacteria bacterium FC1]
MKNCRMLALVALPTFLGMFEFVAVNQVNAQVRPRMAQNTQQPEDRRPHRGPDFAAAAEKLGITEAALKAALGVTSDTQATPGQRPRLDIPGAATTLGITEEQLANALGMPPDLKAALGVPSTPPAPGEHPPRPDFQAAAAKLGVTEAQLIEALGVPPRPFQNGPSNRGQFSRY